MVKYTDVSNARMHGRVYGTMLLTSYIIKQILLSINKLVHNHMQWIKI